ncbi:MAG: hypothetical protein RL021_745 [Bacteroidota bacterium]
MMAADNVRTLPHRTVSVRLPFSKSISNRLLLLRAFSKGKVTVNGLSDATDTVRLQRLLEQHSSSYDAGDGGTTLRFLLPYLAMNGSECTLAGNERMNRRPVRELVDALRSLGANILYVAAEGYPPLHILPAEIRGGAVNVDTSRSSQFASALMLAAPFICGGLTLRFSGTRVSDSYVDMTLRVLAAAGVEFIVEDSGVRIPQQQLPETEFDVELDWSSAAFWYQLVALRQECSLLLTGLRTGSFQGDESVSKHFSRLGVVTTPTAEGIRIDSNVPSEMSVPLEFDLRSTPDLAPALIVACFGRRIPAVFTGIEHLRYKESDRMAVLLKYLSAMGARVVHAGGRFELQSFPDQFPSFTVDPHEDHRIAMAFAILSCLHGGVKVSHPEVVRKSYPEFWDQLAACGFTGIAT